MTEATRSDVDVTPVRRRLGTSTDDAAIFLEDTVDRMTAQCIDASPSALALLTPQRLPSGHHTQVDVTEYDTSHLGSFVAAHRRSTGENGQLSNGSSHSKGRPSGQRTALHDVTNTSAVKLNFSAGSSSKSPTPTATRMSGSHVGHGHPRAGSHNSSLARSTPQRSAHARSPSAAEPLVPLADFEALQKERNRFEKMYEHQRALYEEMAEKQAETHQTLQDKIIEVVALSTRNEESKRFIRQLKREFSESRTRVMDMQNKALEEAKTERNAKSRYEALLQSQERKYDRLVERHETKLAGMESLVKDLTCLRGEQDQLHVSQLDSLLKAAYAKSTALFSDLLRQGRQIDLLYDAKGDLESQLEALRRERREADAAMREERRRSMAEAERHIEQIEEQQQSILNLRQMLIRTMDNRDNVFAYSRGPRREHGRGDEDRDDAANSSGSSSFSSSPSSIAEDGEGDRSFNAEDGNDDDDDDEPLHREAAATVDCDGEEEVKEERPNPLLDATATTSALRIARSGGQSRPVISASAAAPALASNAVVVHRRGTTSTPTGPTRVTTTAAEAPPLPLTSRSAAAPSVVRQEQPYRIQRRPELGGEEKRSVEKDEKDENAERGRGGVVGNNTTRAARPLATLSISTHPRDARVGGSGGAEETQRVSPSTSPGSKGVTSRRRLDFTTALAAVMEKRRLDRGAREEGASGESNAKTGAASVGKGEAGKENGGPVGGHRAVVRSCAVGSIATARTTAQTEREEDEEEEPRLFPRAGLSLRE